MSEYPVEIVSLQPQRAAVVRAVVSHGGIGEFLVDAFARVLMEVSAQHAAPSGPPFARYEVAADGFSIEAGFPISKAIDDASGVHGVELPGGPAATTVHSGAYAGLAAAYAVLEAWFADNGFAPAGAPWETYLEGPEVPQPRTLVVWPCRRSAQ